MPVEFKIVIPARYGATRLSGKPLRKIQNKSMIQWVYEAATSSVAEQVIVATDDSRIADVVTDFGGKVCITSSSHQTGSDRLVEVIEQLNWSDDTVIVNLQRDEPLMPSANMTQVARNLQVSNCHMATLHKTINHEHALDPNIVKLIYDYRNRAIYFSRSPIPYDRESSNEPYYGHIGIYAYRAAFLKTFTRLPVCELETREKLEQLRSLWHGYSIHTELAAELPGPGVDTEQDLLAVQQILEKRSQSNK